MILGILLTQGHRLLSIAAMIDVFESVNSLYTASGKAPLFTIKLLQDSLPAENNYSGYTPEFIEAQDTCDIILIPAFKPDVLPGAINNNTSYIPWLHEQYSKGAAIASFCTGAFLLAATGLLNGRPATTHIDAGGHFSRTFPEVLLQADAVVTEADRVYTSGGATNSFHLMLRLIEVYAGRAVTIRIAKQFSIDIDRTIQTYFGTFLPIDNHNDDLVKQTQHSIKHNFKTAGTIEEIIAHIPSSRRNLVRRFKQATGITPIEYLQKIRIEAAKEQLELSRSSIMEVMLDSGYNDIKTFRTLFKKNVGMTPKMYRDKFNAGAI